RLGSGEQTQLVRTQDERFEQEIETQRRESRQWFVLVGESLCDQSLDKARARRAILVRIVGVEDGFANDRVGGFREEAPAEVIKSADAWSAVCKARASGQQRLGAKDLDPLGEAERLAGEDQAEQGAKPPDRVAWQSAARLRMGEGWKLWAERFEIEQEQGQNEVRGWIEHFLILLGGIEGRQLTTRAFQRAFMLSREGQVMALEELDHIAVDVNDLHMTPLSESGSGKPS